MAKIEPLKENASYSSDSPRNFTAKLMAPGEYKGKIIDIGYTTDQEKTRNILYVALARVDKESLTPRVIRARFDINKPNDSVKYELDRISSFAKAIGIRESFDTDDSEFLNLLIKKSLFTDIFFVVDRLNSQQGHSFNVVKGFRPNEKSPESPERRTEEVQQTHDDDIPF